MATYTWRAANGAFDSASNWDPAVIPSAVDTALFNTASGGTPGTITGAGSVDTIDFSAAGWSVAGQLSANSVNVFNGLVAIAGTSASLVANAAFSLSGGSLSIVNGGTLAVPQGGSASFGSGSLSVGSGGIASINGALRLGAGGTTSALVDAAVLTVAGVLSFGTTGGSSASLTVRDGGQAVVNAARDDTQPYLQLGAVGGASGTVRVDGAGSMLLMSQDSAGIGVSGAGEFDVTGGASARFTSQNNARNPALVLGVQRFASGTVTVSGTGSTLASGGSVIVGEGGAGSMTVSGGATATSVGVISGQAALSVGASSFGTGSLTVTGAGSTFTASGLAVIGGDNRGSGLSGGGFGTVAITGGGLLQTGSMAVLSGSSVTIDGSSQANVAGDLSLAGTVTDSGTLSVSGTVSGGGTLTVAGGFVSVGTLSGVNVSFSGTGATLRIGALSGTSQVSGLQTGDKIDLGGATASINGSTISTSSGSLVLVGGGAVSLSGDGGGGTFVTTGEATVGVFRFFDSNYGTHFFSSNVTEKNTIITSRPDLVYEGVGLESVDPSANDPNAASVYRFFDSNYGTHFFTASSAERDTVIANRPDLLYEGTGFIEHTTQQPGDVGVYRFFDTHYGTHFYTADTNEYNSIKATRADLIDEGIGFYAPGS